MMHLADFYGIDLEIVCRVASVLSPGVAWGQVVMALPHYLAGSVVSGFYGRNLVKADTMLRGRFIDPEAAPKTYAFAINLAGHYQLVTVDRWAARAAGVDPPNTIKRYRAIAEAYTEAAELLHLPPAVLQARVWSYVRDHGGLE